MSAADGLAGVWALPGPAVVGVVAGISGRTFVEGDRWVGGYPIPVVGADVGARLPAGFELAASVRRDLAVTEVYEDQAFVYRLGRDSLRFDLKVDPIALAEALSR